MNDMKFKLEHTRSEFLPFSTFNSCHRRASVKMLVSYTNI